MTPPKLTAEIVRRVLADPESVVVWLPAVEMVDVAETGLTPAQAANPAIVVLLDSAEVADLSRLAGSPAATARLASSRLADSLSGGLL